MKKVTFLMALAVAAGMASCTAQSPKADLKNKTFRIAHMGELTMDDMRSITSNIVDILNI